MVLKLKIIKQELQFEECLKQRLEFICEFAKVTTTFINGSIRKLEKTNLTYIEPHKVIIKSITFLVFNYSNDVYISNLSKKIIRISCIFSFAMSFKFTYVFFSMCNNSCYREMLFFHLRSFPQIYRRPQESVLDNFLMKVSNPL